MSVARRSLALAGLWLAVSTAVVLAPGCYGRNCEGETATFGKRATEGQMVDDRTWASNPWQGEWLPFPRQQYYIFDIQALAGRTPEQITPYLSGQHDPANGGNFTIGSGNLAILQNIGPNRIDIRNDSCSDYFLRLVLTVPPLPPETDAGGSTIDLADAGVVGPDAGGDASDGGDDGP